VTPRSEPRPSARKPTAPAAGAAVAPAPVAAPRLDLTALLDRAGDVAIAATGGHISYVNRSALELLGCTEAGQVMGKRLETVIDPHAIHDLLVARQASGGRDSGWIRSAIKAANGTSTDVDLLLVPLAESDTLAVIARRVNVTAVLDPNTPAAAIHAAEGLKNLIANMAHELRTPLNAIIGFSEIIAEKMFGDINERYAAYAGDILSSGHHLLRIINDILDYAKVESGEMALRLERVMPAEVIRAGLRLVTAQAAQAGVEMIDELGESQTQLRVDPTKVKQIIVNLVSNAVKFTPRGGRIRVGSKLLAPDRVEVWVVDTGIGMTEAEAAEAILPFRQPKRPPDGSYAGTGLGLPIAKALVVLHGGDFRIRSAPRVGTEVRFTLVSQERPQAGDGAASSGK
jgi:signal transduction histidine kinase